MVGAAVKRIACAAVAVVLAGCATRTVVQTVKVPVPVRCDAPAPVRPVMPTEQFSALPALDAWVRAARAELLRREGYEGELRAALSACTSAAP